MNVLFRVFFVFWGQPSHQEAQAQILPNAVSCSIWTRRTAKHADWAWQLSKAGLQGLFKAKICTVSGWKRQFDKWYSADCKRGQRKGATSKSVKNRQKVSRQTSTLFDNFRAGPKHQNPLKVSKYFSTLFRQFSRSTNFPAPFGNPRGTRLWNSPPPPPKRCKQPGLKHAGLETQKLHSHYHRGRWPTSVKISYYLELEVPMRPLSRFLVG